MDVVTEIRRYSISPPWYEDAAVADRLWRCVISTLGPACDELWLRFGNLEDLSTLVPVEQYRRLEELVGPYWGVPDPMRSVPAPGEVESILGDVLQGLADDLARAGFVSPGTPGRAHKYEPYGCAVVPVTPDLLNLIVNLTASDGRSTEEVLSRLADHWHFRSAGRDLIGTGDGMAGMGLHLSPSELASLRSSLASAGLDPELIRAVG